ncbi:MAG: deoxyribonuclease [Chitinophagaceae bacterium]|nr:deoxyribonuclease [Chitinophagaceae bacterium]
MSSTHLEFKRQIFDQVHLNGPFPKHFYKDNPFYGIEEDISQEHIYRRTYVDGIRHGQNYIIGLDKKHIVASAFSSGFTYGYKLIVKNNKVVEFAVYDCGVQIEWNRVNEKELEVLECLSKGEYEDDFKKWIKTSNVVQKILDTIAEGTDENDYASIHLSLTLASPDPEKQDEMARAEWAYYRQKRMKEGFYHDDFLPYYYLQNEMRDMVIMEDDLPDEIKYIAGVDVAYNDIEQRMVGGIVVLDAQTLEVIDHAIHEMDVVFPYVPGLFSFREVPPVVEAFKKLKVKPDLIVCDAQGIAHPKNVGMATHLGIELDIPTIGCAKRRLVGHYEKEALGNKRGDSQSLIWDNKEVGKALRTQDNTNPMFVSIGHRISLETACEWVLMLSPEYRLPETTRQADQLVNKIMKDRTEIDFLGDEQE